MSAEAEVVSLDAHRRTPRPGVLFRATDAGLVELVVQRSNGEQLVVEMTAEWAARLLMQGTDAVDVATDIERRGGGR